MGLSDYVADLLRKGCALVRATLVAGLALSDGCRCAARLRRLERRMSLSGVCVCELVETSQPGAWSDGSRLVLERCSSLLKRVVCCKLALRPCRVIVSLCKFHHSFHSLASMI